ncbi:lysozyme inhibitor LprI family protein [Caballeronia sp. Lep1P3]|uniref:lysozyme inhibitor LprI family protein n=1 Tax=Caballeronia sp. Lep1P3 TaxID=2878150 RepID=UPI001FD44430|nr:lysozyme inhibitor LprI family protein [Caballeronia sp. Lep1P3]
MNPLRLCLRMTAATLLVATAPAWADSSACMKNAATQIAMDECAGRDLKAADQTLNDTYRTLLGKVSKDGAEQLRKAQRSWLAWRDAQCEFDTMATRGGSIHSMEYAMCVEKLTEAQTAHLQAQLHCKEGDVSCGGQ